MIPSATRIRDARSGRFANLRDGGPLDVLIAGGGISGAPLHDILARRGHRVAVVDRGDFASGTSQASGMLIWGGLLYLKNLDFPTVAGLCKARSRMLADHGREAAPLDLHFLTSHLTAGGRAFMWCALQFYWLMGGCRLARPRFSRGDAGSSLVYQEGMLRESDSRFVIGRIAGRESLDAIPLNHCAVEAATWDGAERLWRVDLRDRVTGGEHSVKARVLVNAAGVWADGLDRLAGLESPYRHVFSKGVYLMFPRDGLEEARVHPMHGREDVLTEVPWGPVRMWGPTETKVSDPEEGFVVEKEDLRFLLDQARRRLSGRIGAEDVVSMRCGLRPLAVPKGFERDFYPLDLSRRHHVVAHEEKRALSLFGGKFTSGIPVAEHAAGVIARWVGAGRGGWEPVDEVPEMNDRGGFGDGFVTPQWARDHEFCVTLDDYLRRRTSIAQWTPRMGLGSAGENRAGLLEMAAAFADDPADAAAMVDAHEERVRRVHDALLRA